MSDSKPTTLQTLVRGLRLLEVIVAADGTATTKSLSIALGIRTGTCYHLLRTLQAEGYVVRLAGGTYASGNRSTRLSRSVTQKIRPDPTLSAILWRLNLLTKETVYVAGWHNGEIVLKEWIPGQQTTNVAHLEVGYSGNIHARASAKAVAAYAPLSVVVPLMTEEPFERLTERTILTSRALLGEFERVRRQGFAVDVDEFALGVSCVAAPYFSSPGVAEGAFAVSAPSDRFRLSFPTLSAHVRRAAERATEYLQNEQPESSTWGS